MATRSQVLLILSPLIPDVQRKIMRMIFPTFDTTHKLIKRFAYNPYDWEDVLRTLTLFAHSDDRKMCMPLRGEDVRFVEHCCTHLGFGCFDESIMMYEIHDEKATHIKPLSVFQTPETLRWPRTVELIKPVDWHMRTEVPDSLNLDFSPEGDRCGFCGSLWTTWDKSCNMFLCPDCWGAVCRPGEISDELAAYMDCYSLDEYDLY